MRFVVAVTGGVGMPTQTGIVYGPARMSYPEAMDSTPAELAALLAAVAISSGKGTARKGGTLASLKALRAQHGGRR